jgi:hypothetical protein
MSDKDVQVSYAKGFAALIGVLKEARRPGSWFASGAIEVPMPAVEVKGFGMLSFPVPPAQARDLIAAAGERAPYGKGDETLVDEAVRKVWQISPARVKIHGKRAAGLLVAVARLRGPSAGAALIELWTALAKQHAKSGVLLSSSFEALLDAIARHTPPKPAERIWTGYGFDDYETAEPRAPKSLTPTTAAAFLTALHGSLCSARMPDLIRGIGEKPALFPPESVLLPALEKLAIPVANGPAGLWAHCARHYLLRSEHSPAPPRDWAQPATLGGKSPHLRELEAFARDPQAQVHRFRVRKELRQELHRAIERAGLDMTHVTERIGSPQTLICTKTRAGYERACKQFRSDLSDMRRLLALAATRDEGNSALAERLRRTTGAH